MTIKELLNTELSYYGKVRYNKAYKRITLLNWLKLSEKYISTIDVCRSLYLSDKESYKKTKQLNLPCVTISAIFDNYRNVNEVSKINPIIAIDIDGQDNPEISNWEEIKNKCFDIQGVFLASLSVSGNGIFVLVHYDIDKDFNKIYHSLVDDFAKIGLKIDKNCKDMTRLRFISYDNNILIKNNDIEPYANEMDIPVNVTNIKGQSYTEDDKFTYKCIYHLIKENNYKANNYNDWLQDAFRLATLGELGYVLFMYLSQVSDNYNEDAAISKWNEAVKSTRYNKDCLVYYFGKLKQIYGEYKWKEMIINL